MTQFIEDPLYFYNAQIRNYILQFMAIFSDFKVQVGKNDTRDEALIPAYLSYGAKDRVVASIFADNTQNKPIRLPALSAYMNSIDLAPDRRKGVGVVRRETYMPTGGMFPDDITTVEQLMPIPYLTNMELSIWTSNRDEHLQLLEQIFMFFDPILQIQTSDDTFDWTKITTVELTGIRFEENYPSGADRRVIQTTLDFAMPIYIATPAKLKNNFIKKIFTRIGLISTATTGSREILAELDAQGFEYEKLFDLDDLDLPE